MKYNLILASSSPRRSELLKAANIPFEVRVKSIDETVPPGMDVYKVAAHLATEKARATLALLNEGEMLLAADSVVIVNGEILGKPRDRADAMRMLNLLSNNKNEVVTGVCLQSKDKKEVFSSCSTVYFEELTTEEIDYYIDTFQPYDKAGAYAIQEWIGLCKIKKIEGTYANIMGLPVDLVYKHLKQF